MGVYIRNFWATPRTPHFKRCCKMVVPTKECISLGYSHKKYNVWFFQIERFKTYDFVLTLLPNPIILKHVNEFITRSLVALQGVSVIIQALRWYVRVTQPRGYWYVTWKPWTGSAVYVTVRSVPSGSTKLYSPRTVSPSRASYCFCALPLSGSWTPNVYA